MSTPVDLPIHEVILKIMYNADREKPTDLTAKDILWKIDNPEITERYIREVLDWLVRERRVKFYTNKYSLDRHEFLKQKLNKEEDEEDEEDEVLAVGKETFYLKRSNKKIKNTRSKVFFFAGILVMCLITYFFSTMISSKEYFTKQQVSTSSIIKKQKRVRKLILLNDDKNIQKRIAEISNLFSRQNYNNNNLQEEIINLYKVTDSLHQQNHTKLSILEAALAENVKENNRYTNEIVLKIIVGNLVFLLLIIITFFKGKI